MILEEYHETYTQKIIARKNAHCMEKLCQNAFACVLCLTSVFSINVMITSFPWPRPMKMNITNSMNNMEGKKSQIDFNKLERIVTALGVGLEGIMVSYAL